MTYKQYVCLTWTYAKCERLKLIHKQTGNQTTFAALLHSVEEKKSNSKHGMVLDYLNLNELGADTHLELFNFLIL